MEKVASPTLAQLFLRQWRSIAAWSVLGLLLLMAGTVVASRSFSEQLTDVLLGYQLEGIGTGLLAQIRTDRAVDLEHLAFLLQQLPAEGEGLWHLSGSDGTVPEQREIVLESLRLDTPDQVQDLETSLERLQTLLWARRVSHPDLVMLELVFRMKNDQVCLVTGRTQPGFPNTTRSPVVNSVGRAASFKPLEAWSGPVKWQTFRSGNALQVPIRVGGQTMGLLRIELSQASAVRVAQKQTAVLTALGLSGLLALGCGFLLLSLKIRRTSTEKVGRPLETLSELLSSVDSNRDGHIVLAETKEALPRLEEFLAELQAAQEIEQITSAARGHLELLSDTLAENEEIQQKLRDALQRLEEASQVVVQSSKGWMLAEMGAWVAHDLNNKLQGAFSISSNWLERDKPCPVKHLKFLHLSLEKAISQIDEFRNLSRPQSTERVESVSARDLLDDLKLLVSQRVQQANVELEVLVDEGLVYRNIAPGKFQDMLMNLIFNGCDAIGETDRDRGRITLAATGNEFRVSDDGVGIEPARQKELFSRPFFTTKGEDSSGLGLRIVASVASEFGGRVECESTPGQGTTFVVSIGQDHVSS